ncbi:hypothetical protein JCM19240_5712 [Vibrio maritimus]|uniref:Uncharacterized protein n=1 Tax=Vibrio maritimus TaxID=990268 RepID=A0A090SX49_9VIBR|nr:hypothetical protein JCM19240_5712 [Vibrio maritimus]
MDMISTFYEISLGVYIIGVMVITKTSQDLEVHESLQVIEL